LTASWVGSHRWQRQQGHCPTSQQSNGGRASSLKPGNAATCHACQRTLPELRHLAAGADVKGNRQSGGPKAMRHLLKLQQYNGTGSLDTFLTKFQCMASYLRWDDEDKFYLFCTSFKGAAGQVSGTWALVRQWPTSSALSSLQTRFGTQLQAECFKAEMCTRRRAPGEFHQQLHQDNFVDW